MRVGLMVSAAAAALVCAGQASAAIYVTEIEPNNSLATAQLIPTSFTQPVVVMGSLEGSTLDFVDFFKFDTTTSPCDTRTPYCRSIFLRAILSDGSTPIIQLTMPNGQSFMSEGPLSYENFSQDGVYTASLRRKTLASASDYNLSITVTTAPTPEPASWAMMIAGFGAIGAVARRRSAGKMARI